MSAESPNPKPFVSRLRTIVVELAPWLGLLLLSTAFYMPEVGPHLGNRFELILCLGGELVTAVTICAVSFRWKHGIWVRAACMLGVLIVWLFKIDVVIGTTILTRTPLLYDQVFLLNHLNILIGDLWDWTIGSLVIGGLLTIVAVLAGCRWLIYRVSLAIATRPARRTLPVMGAIWLFMIVGTWTQDISKRTFVDWTVPELYDNVQASREMYAAVARGIGASPYADFASSVRLRRKPIVQLFLVESYGRILAVNESTEDWWRELTLSMTDELKEGGWHAVSAFSEAPVSGGRSWLAEATLLTGIRIRFEAEYRHLVGQLHRTPNLVNFLAAQGYQTVLLAPKERARRGMEVTNHYGYSTTVRHDEIGYTGRPIGWGIIPDQYSLGFTHENVFAKAEGPYFFDFHMVSSHAPWRAVPRVLDDWHDLGGKRKRAPKPEDEADADADAEDSEDLSEVLLRMKRYRRVEPNFRYMGKIDAYKISGYSRAIDYDLEVIKRYLLEDPRDKIVIVMGDHQPPLISTEDSSYDVPMHIFARDPALLEEFKAVGFTDGMFIEPGTLPAIAHESFFSLMVRNLARCCSEPGTQVPEVDFDGVVVGH